MPTGQIGISIAGWGIAVDHVIADYVAGAAERLVLEGAERGDLLFVEGQGAILHPLYSGVTLGLLHGCTPHALVLVHEAGADRIDLEDRGGPPGPLIPPLAELSDLLLRLTTPLRPAPVVAIALSTRRIASDDEARAAIAAVEARDRPRLRRSGALRRRAAVARGRERARMTDPRLARYAHLICEYSLGIERVAPPAHPDAARGRAPGGRDGARGLAPRCARERRDGARRGRASDLLRDGSDDQVAYLDPAPLEAVERFDRWLFVWAPGNTAELAGIASARDAAHGARAPSAGSSATTSARPRASCAGWAPPTRRRSARRPRAWAPPPGSASCTRRCCSTSPIPWPPGARWASATRA